MLLYNVYEMSSTTTPARAGRGVPVPGIDTSGPFDAKPQSMTFSGWPLTPPCAQESRRPSLAFSSSDASGPSPGSSFSQPATPVNSMSHSADHFSNPWSGSTDAHINLGSRMNDGCAVGHAQAMYGASFGHGQVHGSSGHLSPPSPFDSQSSPMRDRNWQTPQDSQFDFNVTTGLGQTLYQSSQAIGQQTAAATSMYGNPASSMHGQLEHSVFPNYDNGASDAMFSAPQWVVPSQLGPSQDYPMQDYAAFDHDEKDIDVNTSFGSTGSSFADWEAIGPHSPNALYFEHADEDDYILVKEEVVGSPSEKAYAEYHQQMRLSSSAAHSPVKIEKRGARKPRKSAHGKAWAEHDTGSLRVRFEGKPFQLGFDHNYRPSYVITQPSKSSKTHRCIYESKDGKPCGRSFERGEHLKRHLQSHSNVRNFPCPLQELDCTKRIGRSDNATDHFKTHLKPTGKGRRNKCCNWKTMEDAIRDMYPEKTATKLLTNLEKWYRNALATENWK